ncbi:MAG TPA: prepilin-type N-terminal cleavage/methylation domain-containing protein [Fimbriimonadaceae bacterium]
MKRAFTLIELLVVIAIIAILAAILFPVFAQAKQQAKATTELTQAREVGIGVYLYLNDYDDGMPIFYEYNSQPPAGKPSHKGVEVELYPYIKNTNIFDSPFDNGGPYTASDVPGSTSYWSAYGSSFRFTSCMYTIAANESSQNNVLYTFDRPVNFSEVQAPSNTRAMRLEMFPFFAGQCDKYGYDCPSPYNYYQPWSSLGGSMIFVDSHAKHIANSGQFDNTAVDPAGDLSGAPNADFGSWYYACD